MKRLIIFFLLLVTVLSLYIIFSVGLGIIGEIGSSNNSEKINNVVLNLSYSYVAGLIFYFFISYLPYIQTKKKLKPAINSKIEYLNALVTSFVQTFESNEKKIELKKISSNYVEKLILNKSVLESSYYSIMGLVMTNLDFINGHKENIENLVDKILSYKEYLTSDQILYLEQIRDSKFFQLLKIKHTNKHFHVYYEEKQTRKLIADELNTMINYVNKIS
ncbi:hypothetical protein [Flavobacterium sp. FlaQc-48]|uniref:hypothetical protein n=1 Tax=Flavobacterium sp. FlaQc-48 TaxID=3374181 RepID=UPI003756EF97